MGSAEKVVFLDLRAAPSSLPPLQKVHHLDPGKFSSKRAKNGVLYPFYVYFLKAYHLGKMEWSGSVVIACRGPFILFPKAYLGICSRVPNRNYFAVFSKIVKKPRGDHPMLIKMQYSYRPTVIEFTNNFYQMFKTKGRGMSKAFWTKLKKNCRMVKLWHPLVAVEACLD